MNIRKMSIEDLELLSYADIAYELLKEDKKSMTTPVLFGEVCKLLEINEDAMFELIGDFYTTLTTDKRFTLLENSEWDLKELHSIKLVVDEEEEEEEEEEEVAEETEDEAVTDENIDDYDDVDDMDDFEDLAIVSEDELEDE